MADSKTSNTDKAKINTNKEKTTAKPKKTPQIISEVANPVQPQQVVAAKKSNGLSVIALLLSLVALASSGYLVYSNTIKNATNNTSMAVGLTEIQGNIGRISDVVMTLKGNVQQINDKQTSFVSSDAVAKQLQQQMTPIQEQQVALSESLSIVNQQVSGDDSQYLLNRIGRLLETANTELNLSKNSDAALYALNLAEQQIKSSNDSSLDVVRTRLLADIDALKSIEKADLAAISAKIMAVNSTIQTWPLQNEPNAELVETNVADAGAEATTGFFKEFKRLASKMVKEAVQVQKVDALPKPLLVPEQRYFLNQNLRLQLLTAQNAALQGEQTVYKENLSAASQWIKDYFDIRDQQVNDAIQSLEEIMNVTLKPDLHDISATLKSFNDVTANPSNG